jgi:DNA polymerase (family 10)
MSTEQITTRLPLAKARRIAEKIVAELRPFCERIEIAGSIRRGRPDCGDVDLVVLPGCAAHRENILARCRKNCTPIKNGEQYAEFTLPGPDRFQLDLWFAHNAEISQPDLLDPAVETAPGNFGVLLLARTGSAMFNVWIAQTAKAAGLHFNPHRGIERTRGGRVIASMEEAEIFCALEMDFIPPEKRER